MKNSIITIVGVAVVMAIALFVLEMGAPAAPVQPVVSEESLGEMNRFTSVSNGNVACGNTSTLLAATSTGRQYLAIVNDSSSTVYLGLGVAAVGSNGIRLNATGGSYEINQDNLFTGAVYCIASSTAMVTKVSK